VDELFMRLNAQVMQAKAAIADDLFALEQAKAKYKNSQKTLALSEAQLAGAKALIDAAKAEAEKETKDAVNVGT
jgi:hypothetical protein